MGVVVAMTSRGPARTSAPLVGSAAILFFTGVRYYRMTEDAPATAAPAPKRRKSTKAKRESAARRHG